MNSFELHVTYKWSQRKIWKIKQFTECYEKQVVMLNTRHNLMLFLVGYLMCLINILLEFHEIER